MGIAEVQRLACVTGVLICTPACSDVTLSDAPEPTQYDILTDPNYTNWNDIDSTESGARPSSTVNAQFADCWRLYEAVTFNTETGDPDSEISGALQGSRTEAITVLSHSLEDYGLTLDVENINGAAEVAKELNAQEDLTLQIRNQPSEEGIKVEMAIAIGNESLNFVEASEPFETPFTIYCSGELKERSDLQGDVSDETDGDCSIYIDGAAMCQTNYTLGFGADGSTNNLVLQNWDLQQGNDPSNGNDIQKYSVPSEEGGSVCHSWPEDSVVDEGVCPFVGDSSTVAESQMSFIGESFINTAGRFGVGTVTTVIPRGRL